MLRWHLSIDRVRFSSVSLSFDPAAVMGEWNTLTALEDEKTVLRYVVICSTAAVSCPSIAMIKPLVLKAGDAGLGSASGGDILARFLILLVIGMDITIASTDLAWVTSLEDEAF